MDEYKLKLLLKEFEGFSARSGLFEREYRKICNEYIEYRKNTSEARINNHYPCCVWSNPKTTAGPDTCICVHYGWLPKCLSREIGRLIGMEYILEKLEG